MVRVCALLVVLAGCGTAPAVEHPTKEDYLAALRFEGNRAITTKYLEPRLAMTTSIGRRSIDDYNLLLDTQRIKTAYEKIGYFAVDVQTRQEHNGNALTIVFAIKEGQRAHTRVEIAGLPDDVSDASARKVIPLAEGDRFDYDKFGDAKDPLQRVLGDAGYAHAEIVGTVVADRAHALATIRFAISAGPKTTFGEIAILGADGGALSESIIERLKFARGDPYSQSKLEATQAAVYSMGLFASVRVEPDKDNQTAIVPVKITVVPVTKNEVTAGGGGGLDPLTYNLHLRAGWVRHAFLTPLTTLNIDLRPEYAVERELCDIASVLSCKRDFRGRLLATLTQQDLLFPDVKGTLEGGFDYIVWEPYAVLAAHVRVALATPIPHIPKLQLRVGWQFGVYDFPDIYVDRPTATLLGIDTINYIGAYTGALVLDLRDKPIEPTSGFYAEVAVTKGTPYALGNFDYLEVIPDVRGFIPLGTVTLAARARVGVISGDIPATERFFGGGISSMRGFGQRRLTPYGPSTFDGSLLPIGGAGLIEGSIELRFPLASPWGIDLGAVAFFDAGDVTLSASALDPLNLYYATGFGLRWLSPIGPVGADLGFRLNKRTTGEPGSEEVVVPQIAVGEAF